MKRTRSVKSEEAGKPASSKKTKGRGHMDIKSPTSRTLLRMLRVGTGEATANNTSKAEAEAHIRRLAGNFTPHIALAKRYAGREALQELLKNYLGKPITFQQAVECFDNPYNRGLQATQALYDLLGGKPWPPYSENAVAVQQDPEGWQLGSDSKQEPVEELECGLRTANSPDVLQGLEGCPGVKLPALSSNISPRIPFGRTVTTGVVESVVVPAAPVDERKLDLALVDEFRPVITTGFSKMGTAFQLEAELEMYARHAGVRCASLELKSFQLLTHNHSPPAALVTIRRRASNAGPQTEVPDDKPISLAGLRCSNILAIKPPAMSMPAT